MTPTDVARLREVAQWTREDIASYADEADCIQIATAMEAGADALEELHTAQTQVEQLTYELRLWEAAAGMSTEQAQAAGHLRSIQAGAVALEEVHTAQTQIERLRTALAAARWWMLEHGLPLTNGQAVLIRGPSWVNIDSALDQADQDRQP